MADERSPLLENAETAPAPNNTNDTSQHTIKPPSAPAGPSTNTLNPHPHETRPSVWPPAPSYALLKFRHAVGINIPADSEHQPQVLNNRNCPPRGLYKHVLSSRRGYLVNYHTINIIYYVFVIAQLIIGATLASLGSLSKLHPLTVTLLGISNSVIAGILALFKSQDLPDRIRKDEFEERKVRDFIESVEGMLSAGVSVREVYFGFIGAQKRAYMNGDGSDDDLVDELIKSVFDQYNVARDTAELNRPDNYAHQVEGADNQPSRKTPGSTVSQRPQNRIAIGSASGRSLQIS